jgi:hypothetical protein
LQKGDTTAQPALSLFWPPVQAPVAERLDNSRLAPWTEACRVRAPFAPARVVSSSAPPLSGRVRSPPGASPRGSVARVEAES